MSQSRHFAAPTYLVAFALALIPPIDSAMKVLPFRIGDPRWRFGAFGLVSNELMLSVTGLLIAFLATTVFEHARLRRILGILTGLAVLVIASAWIVFALDALQVRNDVRPAAALAFKVATTTAALKSLLAMITLATLTLASFRMPRVASSKAVRGSGMIVSGRGSQGTPINGREVVVPVEPTA